MIFHGDMLVYRRVYFDILMFIFTFPKTNIAPENHPLKLKMENHHQSKNKQKTYINSGASKNMSSWLGFCWWYLPDFVQRFPPFFPNLGDLRKAMMFFETVTKQKSSPPGDSSRDLFIPDPWRSRFTFDFGSRDFTIPNKVTSRIARQLSGVVRRWLCFFP